MINYGLINKQNKLVALARISVVPYGMSVVATAVGNAQAPHTAYLMHQIAAGITSQELVEFVQGYTARLHQDMKARGKDIRYLLSLDDPNAVDRRESRTDRCAS